MPVPAAIVTASQQYGFNNGFLVKMVEDLAPEEWLRRPDDKTNHIAWIVGHVVWTRKMLLKRLGTEWSQPWLDLFKRGVKIDETAAFPSPETLLEGWKEVGNALAQAFENVSDEFLAQPASQPGPPSSDGKESGIVSFLAWHETYHIGQASYLRCWLGHKGLMG
jgi:uncharacterized damage-inducible protein DinB